MADNEAGADSSAPGYEPDALYDVRLNSVVKVGGMKLLPINEHHIKGSVLSRIVSEYPDAIGSAAKLG